jgi:tetratricopeptide (TPR) repeat protein
MNALNIPGIEPNPFCYVLQGYGWALRGNADMSAQKFDQANALLQAGPQTGQDREMYALVLVKSLSLLNKSPKAVQAITRLVGDPEGTHDPGLLVAFAEALLSIPSRTADGMKYLDRAVQLDPKNGEAWKYKGIAKCRELTEEKTKLSGEQQRAVIEEAKSDLLKAAAFGQKDASVQELLAGLYVASGDEVNAQQHLREACEMNPKAAICVKLRAVLPHSSASHD